MRLVIFANLLAWVCLGNISGFWEMNGFKENCIEIIQASDSKTFRTDSTTIDHAIWKDMTGEVTSPTGGTVNIVTEVKTNQLRFTFTETLLSIIDETHTVSYHRVDECSSTIDMKSFETNLLGKFSVGADFDARGAPDVSGVWRSTVASGFCFKYTLVGKAKYDVKVAAGSLMYQAITKSSTQLVEHLADGRWKAIGTSKTRLGSVEVIIYFKSANRLYFTMANGDPGFHGGHMVKLTAAEATAATSSGCFFPGTASTMENFHFAVRALGNGGNGVVIGVVSAVVVLVVAVKVFLGRGWNAKVGE